MEKTQNNAPATQECNFETPEGFEYKIGKRYAGSAFLGPTGIFTYRPYGHRERERDEKGEEIPSRFVSEDECCTVQEFKEKYKITIDIEKRNLTEVRLFSMITSQINFLNKILFKCKTSPRAGRNS